MITNIIGFVWGGEYFKVSRLLSFLCASLTSDRRLLQHIVSWCRWLVGWLRS